MNLSSAQQLFNNSTISDLKDMNKTLSDFIPQIGQLFTALLVLTGNSLILWAIHHFSSLHKVTYYLLGNIAVADVVYAVGLAMSSVCVIFGLGTTALTIVSFPLLVSGWMSLSGTVLVSLHSFVAVKFPVRFNDGFDPKMAVLLMAGIWGFWIVHTVTGILTVDWNYQEQDDSLELPIADAYTVSRVALNVMHLAVLVCLQVSTVLQIRSAKRSLQGQGQGHPVTSAALDRLNNTSRIVGIVSTITVLCLIAWIPVSVLVLLQIFCPSCGITVTHYRLSRICFLPNLIGNIVIYFVKSREFKKVLKIMCKCRANQVSPE